MQNNIHDDAKKIYEIGYLLVSSVPKEKATDIVAILKEALSKKGAEIIAEEAPELIPLAYTMVKKIGTANHRFDEAYFGWVKFELSGKEIEEVKKNFEMHPDMLRTLIITTVRDNTYLGKKAPVAPTAALVPDAAVDGAAEAPGTEPLPLEAKPAPASLEDMDKSIDEMVKGA